MNKKLGTTLIAIGVALSIAAITGIINELVSAFKGKADTVDVDLAVDTLKESQERDRERIKEEIAKERLATRERAEEKAKEFYKMMEAEARLQISRDRSRQREIDKVIETQRLLIRQISK